jgi:hypothetical protein
MYTRANTPDGQNMVISLHGSKDFSHFDTHIPIDLNRGVSVCV